jgi:hypothetical protein
MEPVHSLRQNPYRPYIITAGIILTAVAIIYGTWPQASTVIRAITPTQDAVAACAWCTLCIVSILGIASLINPS